MKKIFIFGNGEIAEISKFYFENDSKYEGLKIAGFCVSDEFYKNENFLQLPCCRFSELEKIYPKEEYDGFIAISYRGLNSKRKKIYNDLKNKNYNLVSFVSSKSYSSKFFHGENCLILENQSIQNSVKIGNNVSIWSSNHIGHSSIIKDHTYVSSHVCIGGRTTVGESCFFGVNSAVSDGVSIGNNVFVSMGSNISKNIDNDSIVIQNASSEVKKTDKLYKRLKNNILKKY